MSFASQLAGFKAKTLQKHAAIRVGVDSEMFRSVVDGSELTGAPGQPVDKGTLRDSWKQDVQGDETVTSSDSPHARPVEENWSNVTFKTGGPHSCALTVAGFGRIVETVAKGVSA